MTGNPDVDSLTEDQAKLVLALLYRDDPRLVATVIRHVRSITPCSRCGAVGLIHNPH